MEVYALVFDLLCIGYKTLWTMIFKLSKKNALLKSRKITLLLIIFYVLMAVILMIY